MRIADSKSGFVNLSISDRRLFNVANSNRDIKQPAVGNTKIHSRSLNPKSAIRNPQSEIRNRQSAIGNPKSKVGAAHEVPAFTDQLAFARFQNAPTPRAILFSLTRGRGVVPGWLFLFERFVRDVHQPSAFPIRIMARGKSVSEPPPAGFALVFASSAQCPASASRKTAAPAEAGTVRYSGLG